MLEATTSSTCFQKFIQPVGIGVVVDSLFLSFKMRYSDGDLLSAWFVAQQRVIIIWLPTLASQAPLMTQTFLSSKGQHPSEYHLSVLRHWFWV
jgi:hypothetical protein